MCGLAGLLLRNRQAADQLNAITSRMSSALVHRGPDDSGTWIDAACGIGLAFRRLSIVDLSAHGHQPMVSESGRFVIVFNGEIFNHERLRPQLESAGCRFHGHSDTEVILAAFERWGIEEAVRRFIGMFAMAVWDRQRQQLSLIRDRLGIKPLFVYQHAGVVSFGSELKAMLAVPGFDRTIDVAALTAYLRYLYVPAPRCIFRYAHKVLPGHILTISDPDAPLPDSVPFWTISNAALAGVGNPLEGAMCRKSFRTP